MKNFILTLASVLLGAAAAEAQQPNVGGRPLSPEDVRAVAPALERIRGKASMATSGIGRVFRNAIGASLPSRS